ncbi:MAG: DUF1549 domain-containing protein [Verrucomicrobia bacterium]|nr:DUF1549 domain-containing protein [Verrucomicrobiota bacterium]
MNRAAQLCALSALTLVAGSMVLGATDFARDIQPILAKHCYECHGADLQKGKLRLDERSSALQVVRPDKPEESELYRRITLPRGHDDIMPNRGEPLSKAETERIRDWITQGAIWPDNVVAAKHWAYVAPNRPSVPKIKNKREAKNQIDHFIFARLEKEGMRPSTEADRTTLLRRVHLDLIGLPPSPAEVTAFLADKSPRAYEKVVDRLLASPQYGERWARPWLDLARYADSSGYQRDNLWDIWPYRDWVINALNEDMPFDQFTIEQLAGDLLPNATTQQKVATGFNRCVPTNVEAGADQEETRVNQVFDRVNTLGSVWLGSTLECAQCHNHKYDPISQKEYYQLFSFFNNTPKETEFRTPRSTAALKFDGPYLSLPDAEIEQQRSVIKVQLEEINQRIQRHSETLSAAQDVWEQKLRAESVESGKVHTLEIADFDTESGSFHRTLEDKSVLLIRDDNDSIPNRDTYTITVRTQLPEITGFRLDVLSDPSLPGGGPGRGDEKTPNFVLNDFTVTTTSPGQSAASPVKLRNAKASFSQENFDVSGAIDNRPRSGWAVRPEFARDHWAIFETVNPINFPAGGSLIFKLEQNSGAARTIGRLRLSALTGVVGQKSIPSDIAQILQLPSEKRSPAQKKRLSNHHIATDPTLIKWRTERLKLEGKMKDLRLPQTLVMKELPETRMSSVFVRGNFLEPGESVQADTPAVLHALLEGPPNRLTLARWLVDTNNPLVARVTVNRWWAEFFGIGLVPTPEDFGIKGDSPTHPDLLDWLAVEFMSPTSGGTSNRSLVATKGPRASRSPSNNATIQRSNNSPPPPWSMKHIHRLIVTSATYRQSSAVSPELLEKDDENKLYARAPRFRMEAEMIRDNALSVSGLLSLKQGGPPVRPYQPPGIWESKVGGDNITYELSEGENRYRRGIYIVWKRTSPYPSFINFDATERTACVVKRTRSNTPLQALTLLNDPVYVEAAAALAKRILTENPSGTVNERIRHAFSLCLARTPDDNEITVLERLYNEQLRASQSNPESVRKLLAEFQIPTTVDIPEFAAWHAVAWALLNLNETVTKG